MPKSKKDKERENRIDIEIVPDANDKEERAMGWYYYLEDTLNFPFKAECIMKREISPLKKGEKIEVTDMASENECANEMFVKIFWMDRSFAVPLSQLKGIKTNKKNLEAIKDWHYWVAQGWEM